MPRGRPKTAVQPCRYCNRQFRRQEHLLRHERTHTQEKPFRCDCGQKFTRRDLLARHVRLRHPPEPSAPTAPFVVPAAIPELDQIDFDAEHLVFDSDVDFMAQILSDNPVYSIYAAPSSTAPGRHGMDNDKFSRFSTQLPRLDDLEDGHDESENFALGILPPRLQGDANTSPWHISELGYEKLRLEMHTFYEVPQFFEGLPSLNNWNRYLDKYFFCLHQYLPFLHPSTFHAEDKTPELLLAVALQGALYRFEHAKASELYQMSKAILTERIRRETAQLDAEPLAPSDWPDVSLKARALHRIQTLVLLISYASWASDKMASEAVAMSSQLGVLVREAGIANSDRMEPDAVGWRSWVMVEERRRTLFAAYLLFNLHSIAFNMSPQLMSHEVGLSLPSSTSLWDAKSQQQWQTIALPKELSFQDGLRSLLDGESFDLSLFSSYLLIHGLLQQIYITGSGPMSFLPTDMTHRVTKQLGVALRAWQSSWESNHESSLNPFTSKGPLGLSAASLFRLAHIRLISDPQPFQGLTLGSQTWQTKLRSRLTRSTAVDRAVLHAAHALSLPIRHGIEYVARNATPIWTVEHSLSNFESFFLLRDWIDMMATLGIMGDLRETEKKLLDMVREIILETSFSDTLDINEDNASLCRRMGETVARIWAQIFQGHHVLGIDDAIGARIRQLADSHAY